MIELTEWLATAPYSLNKTEKSTLLTAGLSDLTRHHVEHCDFYRNILHSLTFNIHQVSTCADIPFLPVRLFKELDLLSVSCDQIVKTMTSSGTTGQAVSRIFLDRETSSNQMKVLTKIVNCAAGELKVGSEVQFVTFEVPAIPIEKGKQGIVMAERYFCAFEPVKK